MSNLTTSLPGYAGLNPILDVETPTVNSTYTLPTGANIQAGQRVKVANNGANSGSFPIVSVNASDATLVRQVYPQTDAEFVALQANPTNQAHWLALGVVHSNWANWTSIFAPTGGTATSAVLEFARWRREGDSIHMKVAAHWTQATANAFSVDFSVPAGVAMILDSFQTSFLNRQFANMTTGGSPSTAGVYPTTTTQIELTPALSGGTFTSGNTYAVCWELIQPVTGWSETRG